MRPKLGMAKKRSLYWQALNEFQPKNVRAIVVRILTLVTALSLMSGVSLFADNSSSSAANVEDAKPKPKSVPQKREAWMDASDYSIDNPGVAIVVYGRTPDATNHQIAEFIKARFAEKGVVSKYYTGREEHIGVSFGFYLNGDAYGPVGLKKMMATVDEVAEHAQGLKRLQSRQKR